jgi:hypothetical protein
MSFINNKNKIILCEILYKIYILYNKIVIIIMVGLCVLTIGVVLGAMGISNSINSLQNVIIMKDMRKELNEIKYELHQKDLKHYKNKY